jgi:hypothetical protein
MLSQILVRSSFRIAAAEFQAKYNPNNRSDANLSHVASRICNLL